MAEWVRNLIMVVVMACWAIYIVVSLIRNLEIPQFVWGIPGVIYYALNPTWKKKNKKRDGVNDSDE